MQLLPEIVAMSAEFIELRHKFHEHPELGFQEFNTAKIVAFHLKEWGYEVAENFGRTGVVGLLKKGQGTRSIALRADMDALPMQEETGLAYASKVAGVMHACGHDGHTASLLLTAKYLKDVDFNGTLNLVFQPSEESDSGALRMIEDGLFIRFPTDYIFGWHNMPNPDPSKKFLVKSGGIMASSDEIHIEIQGRGGHASAPQFANDPTIVAANIITALQTVVSRSIDPQESIVLSTGGIIAGNASSYNIIPDKVTLLMNMRALDSNLREESLKKIEDISKGIGSAYGASVHFRVNASVGVTENDADATQLAKEAGLEVFGDSCLFEFKSVMGAEDFSAFSSQVKSAYCFINNGESAYVHNPKYDFNDELLAQAASYFSRLVINYLK